MMFWAMGPNEIEEGFAGQTVLLLLLCGICQSLLWRMCLAVLHGSTKTRVKVQTS